MKKVMITLLAIATITLSASAQQKRDMMARQQNMHQRDMMAKQLNFSEAQKNQAKTINEDFRKKMQELDKNEAITVKEMRDRKAALLKERKTKMDGLLTAEQKTKMAQLKAEQKAKNDERYAKHLAKMKTDLGLSEEQVTKLKSQRTAMQSGAEKIRNNESLSRVQKQEQLMALQAEAKEQHKKIFTPEQLKKREELRKNRGDRSRSK